MEQTKGQHLLPNSTITWLTFLATLAMTGCAAPPIHVRDSFKEASGVETLSLDAKQRVVIFTTRNGRKITCAEPSPDALSAFSSNFGASLQNSAGTAASIAASMVESAASIGLRTQSIQLLRDGMYRSCEAYAAGGIDEAEYNRQQRRYQNLMLSLLAIEQISGAVVAQQVGLGRGESSVAVGKNADDAAAELTQAERDVANAREALTSAQSVLKTTKDACTAAGYAPTDDNCKAVAGKEQDVKNREDDLKNANDKRENAKLKLQAARATIHTSATGASVKFGAGAPTTKMTDASAQYIAEAARTIVSTTLLASFAQEECTRLWGLISPGKIDRAKLTELLQSKSLDLRTAKEVSAQIGADDLADEQRLTATLARSPAHAQAAPLSNEIFSKKNQFFTPPQIEQIKTYLSPDGIEQLLISLRKNCSKLNFEDNSVLFTPQYPKIETSPLKVLGSDREISVAKDASVEFAVIGGLKPYKVINPERQITARLDPDTNILKVSRSDTSDKDRNTTLYVMDATEANVAIHVSLPKTTAKTAASQKKSTPKK
jgi:hypothetical protein